MSIEIRLAQWYDCDAMARLRRAAWLHDLAEDPTLAPMDEGIGIFDQTLQVAGWLRNPRTAAIIAIDGTEPLGYLVIGMDHTCPYRQEPTIFIDGFFVVKEARVRHVGGLLYRYARKMFHPNTPKFWQAIVLTHNKNVQDFAFRFGFVERGKLLERVN